MWRSVVRCFQSGVNTSPGTQYRAAVMKNWPVQSIPANFRFTEEQRFKARAMPRDSGKIPRDFVLSVLYRHQPCEVGLLWQHCTDDPQLVLDSKHHLREVLQQARAEGFISFEKDELTTRWVCHLTRERFEYVRAMVAARAAATEQQAELRGSAVTETSTYSSHFHAMNDKAKEQHEKAIAEQVTRTTEHLRRFQRSEIDYLPYTDLNGKVNFMWWYETVTVPGSEAQAHERVGETPKLPSSQ